MNKSIWDADAEKILVGLVVIIIVAVLTWLFLSR